MTLFGRALALGLRHLAAHPGVHALAAATLALNCFLAGAFGLFLHNLDRHLMASRANAQFQVYWKPGSDMALVSRQWAAIRAMPQVKNVRTFTPDEALDALARGAGGTADLAWLTGTNPLPPTALVLYEVLAADTAAPQAFLARIKNLEGVETVRLSPTQLDVARSLRSLSSTALVPILVCLGLAVALLAYMAARLCLEGHRAEAAIMRLVGAAEWFVRLPWAASSACTGLAGALMGLGSLEMLRAALSGALNVAPLWLDLAPLPPPEALALLLMPPALSALGGWLAARR